MAAAKPPQAADETMPAAPMSEPFHFQGAGSDHGNIDLSGLKFNMGKTARPEANAFMDAVNAGVGHMPAHEAEILTSNAAQASQHVGAMPASDFHQGLMGDFSGMFKALPGAVPDVAAQGAALAELPSMPHERGVRQVGTRGDYIAGTEGDKRPGE